MTAWGAGQQRAVQAFVLGLFAVSLGTALLGMLPWWLDPRLRCVRAYEASVGPRAYQPQRAGDLGTDPWGRPFRAAHIGRLGGTTWGFDLYKVDSAGPDGAWATADDLPVPEDGAALVTFARAFRLELRLLALLAYVLAWLGWACVAHDRPRWLRTAAFALLPLPVAFWAGQLVRRGFAAGWQVEAATPVAGAWAPHVSAYVAGLLFLALLAQLRGAASEPPAG